MWLVMGQPYSVLFDNQLMGLRCNPKGIHIVGCGW